MNDSAKFTPTSIVLVLDWYGRVRDAAQLLSYVIGPLAALFGFALGGPPGLLLGLIVGGLIALVLLLMKAVVDKVLDRLWPLPHVSVEPRPVQGEWGYGRSVNGRLTTAFAMVTITANNPGRSNERITRMRCDLYQRRFMRSLRVETLPVEKELDWLLEAAGKPESRDFTFHRTLADFRSGAKIPVGEELSPKVVVEFGREGRGVTIDMPPITVKGPYPA